MNFIKFSIPTSMDISPKEAKKYCKQVIKPFRTRFLPGTFTYYDDAHYEVVVPGKISDYKLKCLEGIGYNIEQFTETKKTYVAVFVLTLPFLIKGTQFILNMADPGEKFYLKRVRAKIF